MEESTPHIYIIDDDLSFCKSLSRLLTARGFSTECYLSAQSFLDSIPCAQKEGIAIVDFNMPGCDGICLIDKMKELDCDIPVIVITGQAKVDTQARAFKHGAIGYLLKPFSEQSLIDLIESQIKKTKSIS